MIEFKAAVLDTCTIERPFSDSAPLKIETVTAKPPSRHEVLVRINAASLCRSDLSVITGVRAWPMPIVPGHEASGTVLEIGPGVDRLSPGDQVVLVYQPQCGECSCCNSGDVHLCEPGLAANRAGTLLGGESRLSVNGKKVHHHMGLSAFAEMAVVSEHSLVKVDGELEPEIVALFGCAVMCGAGSVINTGKVKAGESIAIVGIGGVGASAILGARLAGASRIFAIDSDQEKRHTALALGATDAMIWLVRKRPRPASLRRGCNFRCSRASCEASGASAWACTTTSSASFEIAEWGVGCRRERLVDLPGSVARFP